LILFHSKRFAMQSAFLEKPFGALKPQVLSDHEENQKRPDSTGQHKEPHLAQ
jgi:hypothetical protein